MGSNRRSILPILSDADLRLYSSSKRLRGRVLDHSVHTEYSCYFHAEHCHGPSNEANGSGSNAAYYLYLDNVEEVWMWNRIISAFRFPLSSNLVARQDRDRVKSYPTIARVKVSERFGRMTQHG